MPPETPNIDDGRALHQMLVEGDPTASARIGEAYFEATLRRLRRSFPNEPDPQLFQDAAADAFMGYFQHPERYHPDDGTLPGYLHMSAAGDYRNLRKSADTRAGRHESLVRRVEDGEGEAEEELDLPSDFDLEQMVLDDANPLWTNLERLFPDESDRQLLGMMLDGVRNTEPYAIVLVITHMPPEAQAHEVKKAKDRIKRKIQRSVDRAELVHDD